MGQTETTKKHSSAIKTFWFFPLLLSYNFQAFAAKHIISCLQYHDRETCDSCIKMIKYHNTSAARDNGDIFSNRVQTAVCPFCF